jgi:hypothetical protein
MIETFTTFFGLDMDKPVSFGFQIVALISIGWFAVKSIIVIKRELRKEHFQQGVIPVLALVYMFFCVVFTFKFVGNFDEINSLNERILRDYFDDFKFLNINENVIYINLLTSLVLTAFTFNFAKSFFSLNSLEFGYFNEVKLKDLFSSNKLGVALEAIFRFFIAFQFVSLEHIFSSDSITLNQDPLGYLKDVGNTGLWLYVLLILWLILVTYLSRYKKQRLFKITWYILSFIQFIFGAIITYYFIFFSESAMQSGEYLKVFYMTLILGFVFSLGIIASIVINEFVNPKCIKNDGSTSNGHIPKSA